MTDHADYSTWSLDALCKLHSHLSDALRHIHRAWELERQTTGTASNYYAELGDTIFADSDRVYKALRSHPDHPLNTILDVPLAEDTAQPDAPLAPKTLSDYRAYDGAGCVVIKGDIINDFRGDAWVFESITRAPQPGKSAKVTATHHGRTQEFYANVFNLTVS